ncbi:hypothetical protein OH687_18725 [Burkholderia anthina]|nr:hypothetical protein OH687_18725 [Burkholderia anthina]
MRNEVRDRVYSRCPFRRDKCGSHELNCRETGTIGIRTCGGGMRKRPAAPWRRRRRGGGEGARRRTRPIAAGCAKAYCGFGKDRGAALGEGAQAARRRDDVRAPRPARVVQTITRPTR